jgi:hypothetical protein
MKTRLLAPLLTAGLAALGSACLEQPTSELRLCQRYCYGQIEAVPTQGASSCEASDDHYWDDCVRTCQRDIDAAQEACRTNLVQAYGCGADHTWFCVPKEGGGRTLTQFDTCRESWDTVYACEEATSPDAGTP